MEISEAYKFCPRCGAKAKRESNHIHCPACGLDTYFNGKPCNGLVLEDEQGRILLVERAIDPGKGLWDVPGGFVEVGEDFEESMRREVREELAIELGELEYAGSITDSYDFQAIEYPTLGVMFAAKLKSGQTIKVDDDVASYKFFKPEELPYDKFAFPWMGKYFRWRYKNLSVL